MDDLLAARSQMAMSLAFHIIFAAIGIAMPLLMVIAEWLWLKTREEVYLELAKRWAKGTAILFAVGAVSGTVLSFELGLLWPHFMGYAGAIIGMPFSLEGFAFFTEAIFLGIYLYGWERVPPRVHLLAGAVVALSGALSGIFVVIANAWMNAPTGFRLVNGQLVDIDPIGAMLNPAALSRSDTLDAGWDVLGFADRLQGLSAGAVTFRTIPTGSAELSTSSDGTAVQVVPAEVRAFTGAAIAADAGDPAAAALLTPSRPVPLGSTDASSARALARFDSSREDEGSGDEEGTSEDQGASDDEGTSDDEDASGSQDGSEDGAASTVAAMPPAPFLLAPPITAAAPGCVN